MQRLRSQVSIRARSLSFKAKTVPSANATVTLNPFADTLTAGPGGRHSNSGITATVFGSYGFVGRYVMNELGSVGSRVYAPFRGDDMDVRDIRQMFDHGQLGLIPFSPRDLDSIRESLKHSDVVVNLIGKHYETKHVVPTRRDTGNLSRINYGFEEVHVTIPQTIARLAREAGVQSFIHMSSLSASETSASVFSRTKALGEAAVRKEFPAAIIVKPANIFGAEDRFLNWIGMAAQYLRCYPMLFNGETKVQPVNVNDVANAIMQIIMNRHEFAGANFSLAGPDVFNYKELVEFVADVTLIKRPMVALPDVVAHSIGLVSEQFMNPFFTADNMKQISEDNILNLVPALQAKKPVRLIGSKWSPSDRLALFEALESAGDQRLEGDEILTPEEASKRIVAENTGHTFTFDDLGINPVSMDKVSFDFLRRFRLGGKFTHVQGYKK